jgi:hypothetical protein
MATILLLLAAVGVSAAYMLATAPQGMEDPDESWDPVAAGHPARLHRPARRSAAAQAKGRHGDRRYHDADHPYHRRRTDGPATD